VKTFDFGRDYFSRKTYRSQEGYDSGIKVCQESAFYRSQS